MSTEDFLKFTTNEKRNIDLELNKYFRNLINNESDFFLKDYFVRLRDFIIPKKGANPAKRIRPMVLIQTFIGVATDETIEKYLNEIRHLSLSIELLHNASIIQDDVIDDDEYRRGLPTFHKRLEDVFKQKNENEYGNSSQWGKGVAIHGGDICAFLGSSILMDSKFEPNLKFQALNAYQSGFNGIERGKIIEHYLQLNSFQNSSLEDYISMAEYKTSKQFDTAAAIGAIMGDARLSQIKPLKRAMSHLGVAYQIENDITDSFGDPSIKSIDLDIKEKKRNILLISAYKNIKSEDKKTFEDIFNKPEEMNMEDIDYIRNIIENSGALEFAKLYAKNMISQAEQDIDSIYPGLREESNDFFKKLCQFTIFEDN